MSDDSDLPRSAALLPIALIAVFALVVWFFRPWLQVLVYAVYTTPMILVALAVGGVTLYAIGARFDPAAGFHVAVPAFFIVLVVGAGLAGLFAGEELGKSTMEDSVVVENLSEADAQKPRVVTKSVAGRYAANTLNFPQYQIKGSDITIHNGTPYWSYALSPDGVWNHFTKQQHGTVMVDMTQQNAEVKTYTGDMQKGVGTAFYNHYKWKLLKSEEYLVDYKDPFMVVHNNEQYVAVPYTKPEFHWTPLPYTVPEWGGVMLVDSDGDVEDLSPEEARAHPALAGQKLYPFDLARKKVAKTKYRNGIVNTWTSHEGEIEVAPVPGDNNDQPFLVMSENGPEYIVAVEPYGNAQGLREVWAIDGRTGEYERYSTEKTLFGPRKATDYVRQAARTTDWNRFTPAEPVPVVVDGQLYWEVRVVPNDHSGIAYIAFVNAQTSDVMEVGQTPEVVAFMEGKQVQQRSNESDADGDQPSIIVQRVGPNGEVIEEMAVYGNESIQINQANETDAQTTRGSMRARPA